MEQKDTALDILSKSMDEGFNAVNQNVQKAKGEIAADVENKLKAAKEEINTNVESKLKAVAEDAESAKAATQRIESKLEEMEQKNATRGMGGNRNGDRTFNEYLVETISDNAERIKSFRRGDDLRFDLKAVGDMSYTSNFPNPGALTQQTIPGVVVQPYESVYLADLLPGGRTDKGSVTYPKHTGGEGGAGVWESGAKPLIDFDFGSDTAHVKWIAGIVRVPREMLDDLDFLMQFIQAHMLRSLKSAENGFILNGTTGTNAISGILDVAQAYDGDFLGAVDRIVDASWGQIVENDFMPTHVILNPRNTVSVGLNKAEGSGEYDLPGGTVAFNGGRLNVAGLNVVPTKLMTKGNFLAMDRNGAMFIRRLLPELRVFEQNKDDVEKNMITFRIEERATLITPFPNAFVTGALVGTEG